MQVAAGIISWLVGFEHCSSDFNAWKIVGIWAVVNGIIAVKLVNHIRIGGKLFMIRYVGNRFIPILVWLRTWQNRVSWVVVMLTIWYSREQQVKPRANREAMGASFKHRAVWVVLVA